MRSWPGVPVPQLPGRGPMPKLFDSATRALSPVAEDSDFRMYVCGITPYDAAHLGHASTYVAFDVVQRAVRDAGLNVRYVQNVTDVDDPLLERAAATGDDWQALAERETERFRQDMAALRVLPPDALIGVSESIDLVVPLIERLRNVDAAYQVDADWYFDVSTDPGFGSVARIADDTMLTLFAERGGDPARPGKRNALDSLLWSGRKPGEPSWPTSLGDGRPGWHVECVAIANDGLAPSFDLQGGGSDLIFPHHQMCASLSLVVEGQPFAHHYAHSGMVALDGEKMSKSKGNLEFVSRLRANGADPAAIRLALLAHHYRSDWEWSDDAMHTATARLNRWRAAIAAEHHAPAIPVLAEVRAALADDLNTPAALAIIDAWCDGTGHDPSGATLLSHVVDALLGIDLSAPAAP